MCAHIVILLIISLIIFVNTRNGIPFTRTWRTNAYGVDWNYWNVACKFERTLLDFKFLPD